jgi:HEAT repeat protein
VKAIRQLGTNAVPHLLRPVYLRDGKFKAQCVQWARKQNFLKIRSAEEKRGQALSAMSVLGADALWAWIEIVTNDLADCEVQVYAAKQISILGRAATPALPVLLMMENHREPRAWSAISWAIQQCDRDGVLPSIRQLRRSSDAELRASAAWSLGFVTNYPDITIPALVTGLGDLDARVWEEAALALGKYATNAVSATNAMRRAMCDPEARVRDAATNALRRMEEMQIEK